MNQQGNLYVLRNDLQLRHGVPQSVVDILSAPELHGLSQVLSQRPAPLLPPGTDPLVAWLSYYRDVPYQNLYPLHFSQLLDMAKEVVLNLLSAGSTVQPYGSSNPYYQSHPYPNLNGLNGYSQQHVPRTYPVVPGTANQNAYIGSTAPTRSPVCSSPARDPWTAAGSQEPHASATQSVPQRTSNPVMGTPSTSFQSPRSPAADAVRNDVVPFSPYPVHVLLPRARGTGAEGQEYSVNYTPELGPVVDASAGDIPEYLLPAGHGTQVPYAYSQERSNGRMLRPKVDHDETCRCHDCLTAFYENSVISDEDDDTAERYRPSQADENWVPPRVIPRGGGPREPSRSVTRRSLPDIDISSARKREETSTERERRLKNRPLPPNEVSKLLDKYDKDHSAKFTTWELVSMKNYRKYQKEIERRKEKQKSSHRDHERRQIEAEKKKKKSRASSSSYSHKVSSTYPSGSSSHSQSASRR